MHPLFILIPGALIGWFLLQKNKSAQATATLPAKHLLPYSVPSASGASNSGVLAVQKELNHLGATPALVEDGIYGPKTHDAIATFQTQMHLNPTGQIDADTLAALQSASIGVTNTQISDAVNAAPSAANDIAPADYQAYSGSSWYGTDESQ